MSEQGSEGDNQSGFGGLLEIVMALGVVLAFSFAPGVVGWLLACLGLFGFGLFRSEKARRRRLGLGGANEVHRTGMTRELLSAFVHFAPLTMVIPTALMLASHGDLFGAAVGWFTAAVGAGAVVGHLREGVHGVIARKKLAESKEDKVELLSEVL